MIHSASRARARRPEAALRRALRACSPVLLSIALLRCGPDPASRAPTDTGFRPAMHGFSFENYTNVPEVSNLTPVEVRRMFGDAVCASMAGGVCQLTPAARRWMITSNALMNGGHCQGLSLLSLLAHRRAVNPMDFGAPTTFGLQRSNNALQREIAYWMATQFTPSQSTWLNTLTPAEVVDRLRRAMQSGQETYSLGFYQRAGGGGHAVTPFAVRGEGANTKIMVYDNNIPGQERELSVDLTANTWSYVASPNPSVTAGRYEGDASTRSLLLVPLSSAMGLQRCTFCGDLAPPGAPLGSALGREVRSDGNGDVRVEDDQGHRIGTGMDGAFVNDFPGAEAQHPLSADLWQDAHEPFYRVPDGRPLTVTLSGTRLSAASPESEVSILGRGVEYAVRDIVLDPGQQDVLTLASSNDSITYRTSGMETPVVSMGFSTPGADYEFGLRVRGDASGQQLGMTLRMSESVLEMVIQDGDGTTYDLECMRIAPDGEPEHFTNFDLSAASAVRLRLRYGEWRGNGAPLAVDIDVGNDGTIDRTEMLADTNQTPFEL